MKRTQKHCDIFIRGIRLLFLCAIVCAAIIPPYSFAQATSTEDTATSSTPEYSKQEQRADLEKQLADLERQIDDHQKTIEQYQKQGKTLKGEISGLNAQIDKLNLKVKGINLSLSKLNQEITETQININRTENKIETNKEALVSAIQKLDENDRENTLMILFSHETLSDFFGAVNNVMLLQDGIHEKLVEITGLRQTLIATKTELYDKKEDQENLKALQLAQKKTQEAIQKTKTKLLKDTKGKETEYQKILKKTQETAAQIRSRIFELLGGGELTFEKAYDYARIAESASGVRASLILSILSRESLLGKNVGRCNYQTAMHPTRDTPYFLELLGKLGINPNSTEARVSCANSHGAYGGAMGPAQFIPSTWKLYAARISSVTKNEPANPWNNSDAFVATGIYIRDLMDSKSCIDYGKEIPSSSQMLRERCAAAKYYAGGSWYKYRFWYGEPVVTKANAFEKDIAVLKAN